MRPDSINNSDRTPMDPTDIFDFPIDQNNYAKGEPQSLSVPDSTPNNKKVHKFTIIDMSRNILPNPANEDQLKQIYSLFSLLPEDELNKVDIRSLLIACLYKVDSKEKIDLSKLFLLVEKNENSTQALIGNNLPSDSVVTLNLIKKIDEKIKEEQRIYQKDKNIRRTDFSAMVRQLTNELKIIDQTKNEIQISILSDFVHEIQAQEFNKSLKVLNGKMPYIRFNLIVLPNRYSSTDLETDIDEFLALWSKICEPEIINFSTLFIEEGLEKNLKSIISTEYNNTKGIINLINPSSGNNQKEVYSRSDVNLNLPPGKYSLSMKSINKGETYPNPTFTYPNGDQYAINNDSKVEFNGGNFNISVETGSNFGHLGHLEILNLKNFKKDVYSVWVKRRLNTTGIGLYVLFLNCVVISIFLLFHLFIQSLPGPRLVKGAILTIQFNKHKERAFFLNENSLINLKKCLIFLKFTLSYLLSATYFDGYLKESFLIGEIKLYLIISHIIILLITSALWYYDQLFSKGQSLNQIN